MATPYQIMVVDDSAIIRLQIARLLRAEGFVVTAMAENGQDALNQLDTLTEPLDVLILDVDMPVLDGLQTLPGILQRQPHLSVLMLSGLTRKNADTSLRAMRAGALDYLTKPDVQHNAAFQSALYDKITALGALTRQRRMPQTSIPRAPLQLRRDDAPRPDIIALAASTGGPRALAVLLDKMTDVTQPITVTQHMPAHFTAILAEQLQRQLHRPVREGQDGMKVEAGQIYLAPGNRHMTFTRRGDGALQIRLDMSPPVRFCRPAFDVMLRSLITCCGNHVLAVILTGLGLDGLDSCRDLAAQGGAVLAQDEASATIWGMPGAVAQAGLCSAVLPLPELAAEIARRAA